MGFYYVILKHSKSLSWDCTKFMHIWSTHHMHVYTVNVNLHCLCDDRDATLESAAYIWLMPDWFFCWVSSVWYSISVAYKETVKAFSVRYC